MIVFLFLIYSFIVGMNRNHTQRCKTKPLVLTHDFNHKMQFSNASSRFVILVGSAIAKMINPSKIPLTALHSFDLISITMTLEPETPQETPENSSPTPRQAKAKKIQKLLDKGLNILLVVSIILWGINRFFMPASQEVDNAQNLTQLQHEAESAFHAAKKNDYSVTLKKPRPILPAPAVAFMASDLNTIMEDMGDKPTLIFLYASWCPFCHKMFPTISNITQTMQNKIRIIPISIDEKPEAFIHYLAQHAPTPTFTPYVFADSGERLKARDLLTKKGLQFTGSIPYMAVFRKGKSLAQIVGVLDNESLLKLINDAGTLQDKTTITKPSSSITY